MGFQSTSVEGRAWIDGDYLVWLRAALRSGHEAGSAGSALSAVGGRRVASAVVWEML